VEELCPGLRPEAVEYNGGVAGVTEIMHTLTRKKKQ
jgi:hypothetical protein